MNNCEILFTKMEAGGNDYIYFDCFHNNIDIEALKPHIKYLCDRHFGVGADGVIFILPSTLASAKMIMYNKDGTESFMCGNGIRCVAKYLYDKKIVTQSQLSIETKSGIKPISMHINKGRVNNISVRMGHPQFTPQLVPVLTDKSIFVKEMIQIGDVSYETTCVSMGNPHAVIFTEHINHLNIDEIGAMISCNYRFPERTNVEFVEKKDNYNVYMRVYERGTGETLSCGSGACAIVAAGVIAGLLHQNEPIHIIQKGGVVDVNYQDTDGILLTGDAKHIYNGKILLKQKT